MSRNSSGFKGFRDSIRSTSSDMLDEESNASSSILMSDEDPTFNTSNRVPRDQKTTEFNANEDRFTSLDGVRAGIKAEGLESCRLIFGIDYTMSNRSQGKNTFGGKNLHDLGSLNPYQEVICILGEVLEPLNNAPEGAIPAFGFGDSVTQDKSIFKLKPEEGECRGFMEVLEVYEKITPKVRLGGPTNFAPLIDKAVEIVKNSGNMYHILVIVADGQVSNEEETRHSIEKASDHPLSIIMIGVGDGPWDTMDEFDDQLPKRRFDNFQFVNFYEIISKSKNPQATFALNALMEIPDQYKAIKNLRLFNN
ncbi:hypothetical protein CHS0354_026580 [Potamilus streckersoni]|uniref:VWFA domain-containing protein n=2 Tax=Potamilus streckersoni TaxID=2493646 RepID=A0AAE0TIW4_9BIVA|nr:hypothetical protein CHS0354_026580 [Potamilus streckersoni]